MIPIASDAHAETWSMNRNAPAGGNKGRARATFWHQGKARREEGRAQRKGRWSWERQVFLGHFKSLCSVVVLQPQGHWGALRFCTGELAWLEFCFGKTTLDSLWRVAWEGGREWNSGGSQSPRRQQWWFGLQKWWWCVKMEKLNGFRRYQNITLAGHCELGRGVRQREVSRMSPGLPGFLLGVFPFIGREHWRNTWLEAWGGGVVWWGWFWTCWV